MDGSIWSFLNCTEGSVLIHLNGTHCSIWSYLRFLTKYAPTRFPQLGTSVDNCHYARKAPQPIGNIMLYLKCNVSVLGGDYQADWSGHGLVWSSLVWSGLVQTGLVLVWSDHICVTLVPHPRSRLSNSY